MAAEEVTRPRIVLISLNWQPYFDEAYGSLLTELGSKASLQRAKKTGSAIRLLSEQPQPYAALITDEALTNAKNARVWEAVLQYVRQGGTSVIMGLFASYVKPMAIKPFFAKAGLQWEVGSYHRTTLVLNREVVANDLATKLPPQYSQKAVFVKNVAFTDAWYHTDENSVVESRVFAPTNANIAGETAVALASIGRGKLRYVGDVNTEKGSFAVILAMCGL
ncbi:hypothetical protein GGS23DRAFT_590703 [Durotheca rogersii]|uniref:uncharacterized protein n=1 Tax=Durotheca rogersii TaxID=419775 RepID=UPI00221FF256|nr:uncharacterized protein GGS23DRAFT_590703 [Durotheca rogersii]KAI5854486.1 hypothetical protein GGS23DRAFT_590703 [Durotheca rogersii]